MTTKTSGARTGRADSRLAIRLLVTTLLTGGAVGLLGGCEINKPELPTFDTSLTIPLGVERVDVLELVEDEEFLVVGSDSSLGFFIDGEPDTLNFDFDLSADIGSQSVRQGLGNFELPAADPMDYAFRLGQLWPAADGLVAQPAVVPAFPIDTASGGQDLPDIDSAVLAAGGVTITVTNGLPVPISADSGPDQVILSLVNPANGDEFADFVFPAIAPGGQSTRTADLAGVTLPGEVAVVMIGGSPGSAGAVVTVNGDDAIGIAAAFTGLVVSEATAVVGAQTFLTTFATELPADYAITSAVIGSGSVRMALANDMPVPCTARVTWPSLLAQDHQPLSAVFTLPAGQSAERAIDFAGCILEAGGVPLSALNAEVDIETPGSAGVAVTMTAGDGLTAEIQGGSLTFSSITGAVPAYDVRIDPIVEEIDLPDELDGLEMTAAAMVLRLTNSAGLPGELDLTLTGTSATGQVRSLQVVRDIAAAFNERAPATTDIVLDESNSGILAFLNNLPETITLSGSVLVGGDGSTGTVHPDDFAVVAWDITAPVEVVITGATLSGDPRLVDLEQDVRDMIDDHALGAYLQTEILNHLPVGVELRILAAADLAGLDAAPLLVLGPLTVDAAPCDPLTHTVSEALISRPVLALTGEQARVFALPGLVTRVDVVLPSTAGLPVRMMTTDYIEVRGTVQIDVHVNDQW